MTYFLGVQVCDQQKVVTPPDDKPCEYRSASTTSGSSSQIVLPLLKEPEVSKPVVKNFYQIESPTCNSHPVVARHTLPSFAKKSKSKKENCFESDESDEYEPRLTVSQNHAVAEEWMVVLTSPIVKVLDHFNFLFLYVQEILENFENKVQHFSFLSGAR